MRWRAGAKAGWRAPAQGQHIRDNERVGRDGTASARPRVGGGKVARDALEHEGGDADEGGLEVM
jgi:NAD(P)H-nitrite reductase large subunit